MAALAGSHNFIADFGMTFSRALVRKDSKRRTIVITDTTAYMAIKEVSGQILLEISTSDYIDIDGARGTVSINIPPSVMSNLPEGKYTYALEFTESSGIQERIVRGDFTVRSA